MVRSRPGNRSFGLSVGTVLVLVALYSAWRGRVVIALTIAAAGVTLALVGILAPAALERPAAAWWRVARVLAWVNTRVVLTVIFWTLVTPTGVLRRMTGWDPLQRRRRGSSGWTAYPASRRDPKHFDRMY
jgi:hypothetical protein